MAGALDFETGLPNAGGLPQSCTVKFNHRIIYEKNADFRNVDAWGVRVCR
jgi:hypothetical protein